MVSRILLRSVLFVVPCLALAATTITAQDRPTLGEDDYDQWERLGPAVLSPQGLWLAVSVGRVSDENELRIHQTDSDSVVVVSYGTRPAFSADGAWLAYAIGVSEDNISRWPSSSVSTSARRSGPQNRR